MENSVKGYYFDNLNYHWYCCYCNRYYSDTIQSEPHMTKVTWFLGTGFF